MLQIDWKSRTPVYDQVVEGIVKLRRLGVLKPDEQLPSVRSMAISLGVNPNTVQKAYTILESNGIIYSVQGKGSFLSADESAQKMMDDICEAEFREATSKAQKIGLSRERVKAIIDQIYDREGAR